MTDMTDVTTPKQPSYIISPELQRHFWMRFSVFRLLAPPVFILCAIYAIVTFYGLRWPHELYDRAIQFYGILIVIWGNYEAANVLREEVRSNTWDFQRMSPMSPASLIFGKLFGATSYIWYASLPLLLVAVYAWVTRMGGTSVSIGGGVDPENIFFMVFFMIVAGVAGHAVAFLASFDGMVGKAHYDPRNRQPRNIAAFLAGLGVSFSIYQVLGKGFYRSRTIFDKYTQVEWFGVSIAIEFFAIASAAFFLFWIFMGIYRLARVELMYRTTPVYWFLAVGSIALYLAGCVYDPKVLGDTDLLADKKDYACLFYFFVMSLSATYYAVLAEAADGRRYRRFLSALQKMEWREIFENMPKWVASSFWVLGSLFVFIASSVGQGVDQEIGFFSIRMFIALALSLFLFFVRDAIVLHLLATFGPDRKQTFERIAYYVFVYFLLPAIHLTAAVKNMNIPALSVLGFGKQTAVFHPIMYAGWYYPNFFAKFTAGLLPVILQILFLVAGTFVFMALKKKTPGDLFKGKA